MDKAATIHRPVLLNEIADSLNFGKNKTEGHILVDATFGGGGHSSEICKRYPGVKIIALDADKSALERGKSSFEKKGCDIHFINTNFRDLETVLARLKISKIDGIIFDLGLSSDQLENSGRGFSFQKDEPLLMTMKKAPEEEDVTAYDVVNTWSEKSLHEIIRGYGEEKYARRIAKGIAESREKKQIQTSRELAEVIERSVPSEYKRRKLHFATKTFQAIRMAVNDELGSLTIGLQKGFEALNPGGRMSVISFHSLEDRVVKRFFKEKAGQGLANLINKKPLAAGEKEILINNRARSAKLRILEKK